MRLIRVNSIFVDLKRVCPFLENFCTFAHRKITLNIRWEDVRLWLSEWMREEESHSDVPCSPRILDQLLKLFFLPHPFVRNSTLILCLFFLRPYKYYYYCCFIVGFWHSQVLFRDLNERLYLLFIIIFRHIRRNQRQRL